MKQEFENLRVGGSRPPGDKVEQKEHQQAAEQAAEEVESRGPQAHREKEKFALRPEDGERPR